MIAACAASADLAAGRSDYAVVRVNVEPHSVGAEICRHRWVVRSNQHGSESSLCRSVDGILSEQADERFGEPRTRSEAFADMVALVHHVSMPGRPHAVIGRSARLAGSPISDTVGAWVVGVWLRLAAAYRPGEVGQDSVAITGPEGWLKYLSKHASRGVAHYQRQGVPDGWESTGRLWGHGGSWPVVEPVAGVLDDPAFRRLRRMVRGYVIAEARSVALAARPGSDEARRAWGRVSWARRMLRCNDPGLSAVRGVSEWVPGSVLLAMAACAGWDGELTIREVAA